MSLPLQPNRRWWIYLLASAYVLTLCFNASQEAFGPADSGLRYTGRPPDHRPLEVAEVVPRSPMQQAGVRAGDVIEAVGGRIVVGQTDWFLARAHFERDKPIEIQVRRGQDRLHLSFTIGTPNWRTLSSGEIAFQATRMFVLLLAIVIAIARPEQLEASLVALMFAMIAVAEAFPPTGWAASLRQLPVMLSIPIALASVSWLLITVPWVSLSVRFPQRVSVRPWFWRLVLSPLIIFVPLIMMSAATVVYGPGDAVAVPGFCRDSPCSIDLGSDAQPFHQSVEVLYACAAELPFGTLGRHIDTGFCDRFRDVRGQQPCGSSRKPTAQVTRPGRIIIPICSRLT
jgi:hypothetical protein